IRRVVSCRLGGRVGRADFASANMTEVAVRRGLKKGLSFSEIRLASRGGRNVSPTFSRPPPRPAPGPHRVHSSLSSPPPDGTPAPPPVGPSFSPPHAISGAPVKGTPISFLKKPPRSHHRRALEIARQMVLEAIPSSDKDRALFDRRTVTELAAVVLDHP